MREGENEKREAGPGGKPTIGECRALTGLEGEGT